MNIPAKHFSYIPILVMLLLQSLSAESQLCSRNIPDTQIAFKSGEQLSYAACYKWGPIFTDVGEVVLTLNTLNSFQNYEVKGTGRTYGFYNTFFKVHDIYEARFSTPSFQSSFFHRNVKEGDYSMKNTYAFDWNRNVINAIIERQQSPPRTVELKMETCTVDVLTFFYYLRSHDFGNAVPNQTYAISIALDDGIYSIKCRYLAKEVKKVKGLNRKVHCLKFAVEVIAGSVFKGNESITLWISDDKNHIPMELESPIIVGKLKGRILSANNLKFPINYAD